MEILHYIKEQTILFNQYALDQLKHPSFKNAYYCVIMAYAITLFFEVILPKQRKHGTIFRKNFLQDTFYVVFNDLLIYVIGFYGLCAATELIFNKGLGAIGIHSIKVADITGWNPIVQVLVMFVLQDFMEYVAHVILHRVDFLWEFHKIHHAQDELSAPSTRHFHWLEMIVFKPLIYFPFAMIGYSIIDYFLFQITVQNIWGFFTHMNIKVKWGFLNYIVNTPETHAWHHAKNLPNKYGVNFASILVVWDLLFKQFYNPPGKVPILGVSDQKNMPKTFLGQQLYPFKQIINKIKSKG
jgi:sterol desaturase/sphingolipid hydroxylase (fatty acid hydroxylase superfamily)